MHEDKAQAEFVIGDLDQEFKVTAAIFAHGRGIQSQSGKLVDTNLPLGQYACQKGRWGRYAQKTSSAHDQCMIFQTFLGKAAYSMDFSQIW